MRAIQISIHDHRPFMFVNHKMAICDGLFSSGEAYVNSEDELNPELNKGLIGYVDLEGVHISKAIDCRRPTLDEISESLSGNDEFIKLAADRGLLDTAESTANILEMGPCHMIILEDEFVLESPVGIEHFSRDTEGTHEAMRRWGNMCIASYRMATEDISEGMPAGLSMLLNSLKNAMGKDPS